MIPEFELEVFEKTDTYEIYRDKKGITHKALREGEVNGMRMCMDQYISHPVTDRKSFLDMKQRYDPSHPHRYPEQWQHKLEQMKKFDAPFVLGRNCEIPGFFWRAREWMGTENLSLAWYDLPDLMHEMMDFFADFTIEVCRPLLNSADFDYITLNEDLCYKTGPLLSPETYRTFILPHMKRVAEFLKSNGVTYIAVDSDGNCEQLIPLFMEAGIDILWPCERAADMDPVRLRRKFGRDLRLWGGVDKRELAKGKKEIDRHLKEFIPLIEEGGFIPTVDHTVPPDVSLENFMYYMEQKQALLNGSL
jgi:uroporphyrinogen decarboxylase